MAVVTDFLTSNVPLVIFFCLGLGYIIGSIKFGGFTLGATVGTLIIGLLISQLCAFEIPSMLKTIFFLMFTYTICFEVGPSFFSSMKSSGIKIIIMSLFFAVSAFGVIMLCGRLFSFDEGCLTGIAAGALTQTSIIGIAQLSDEMSSNATISYALTYLFGTIGFVIFIKSIAPKLLGVDLNTAAKIKIDKLNFKSISEDSTVIGVVQIRAYIVDKRSDCTGKTVEQIEAKFNNQLEIEEIHRSNKPISFSQDTTVNSDDVIIVIGNIDSLVRLDDRHLIETSDPKYHKLSLKTAEIVMTDDFVENGDSILTSNGIILKSFISHKKKSKINSPFTQGNIIKVTGPSHSVDNVAKKFGYIKDTGSITDIAYFSLAIVVGIVIGMLSIKVFNVPISLGESGGALISGLLSGWIYNRKPRVGYIPESTRWFIKSLGLNLYIAALALQVGNRFAEAIKSSGLTILLVGAIVTIAPHLLTLLFSRFVLKLDAADILGGQCGCGTCTAALNAVTEETNSSVFAISYAPGYAVGNIILTLLGIFITIIY